MQNNTKQELVGKVVSISGDKTISVEIITHRVNKLYGKRYKYSKKYAAHDEKNEAVVGDRVKIIEVRPLSKNKRHRLLEIIEKAVIL